MPNSGKTPKVSYLDNLKKELGQYNKARNASADNSYKATYYPPNARAEKGLGREYYQKFQKAETKKEKSAFGQLAGALLQGRRYDSKGKQINK